jgi:hypothetical protein
MSIGRAALSSTTALAVFFILLCSVGAMAQDATIVFYSHGSSMSSGLPGSKHGVFFGAVYDGDERLLVFKEGIFLKNNRFAIFELPAGLHTFSASYNKHPSKDHPLQIDLKAGQNYFVRAQSESSGILVVEIEHGRLDRTTCEDAHLETLNAKPLPAKAISSTASGEWLRDQSIPDCPVTPLPQTTTSPAP